MFALADGNNFFASCERVFRPDLEGKPVLVLSNNDGCVIARSAEVKALGIPMGVPYFKVRDLCLKHQVNVFSSNFRLYGDLSGRMMSLLSQHAFDIAPYSIDEAFLELGEGPATAMEGYMRQARKQIRQETGLPISIGIAPSKVLAKAANHWAKKHPETDGVFLLGKRNRNEVLASLEVGDLWGIGPNLSASLNQLGIFSALDLSQADSRQLRRQFNVYMEQMITELRGVPCFGLMEGLAKYPTIQATRSFGRPIIDLCELEEGVATYTSRAAIKLRERKLLAQTILVYIKTNPFRPDLPQYKNSFTVGLPHATSDTNLLVKYGLEALRAVYRKGFAYKKAGVWLGEIIEETSYQADLFSREDTPAQQKLMKAMDDINNRFGKETLRNGACGLNPHWSMRSESRSPNYTTAWSDVVTVWAK